jgi:hypothetical protein
MTDEPVALDVNSKRSRVEPVFSWLEAHGPQNWPERLVELAEGLGSAISPGGLLGVSALLLADVRHSAIPPFGGREPTDVAEISCSGLRQ